MVNSYGLIDNSGAVVSGSNDFSVTKLSQGHYLLDFRRYVHDASVVATVRQFQYCDSAGLGITVCNESSNSNKLGVMFNDPSDEYGFSFFLINAEINPSNWRESKP